MNYEQCCQVLEVDPSAGIDEIKQAYRSKAKEWHPDKHSTESQENIENAERIMQSINAAYTSISENYYERLAKDTTNVQETIYKQNDGNDWFNNYVNAEQGAREKKEKYSHLYENLNSRINRHREPSQQASDLSEEQKKNASWRNQNIYANMINKIYETSIFEILLIYMGSKYKDLDINAMIALYIISLDELQNVSQNTEGHRRSA